MDRHTKEQRSRNMRAVRSKDTKIEILLRKALWREGYRYRKNYPGIIGKPDIAFPKYKLAVFCDSEFWHGYQWATKKKNIKSNHDFWTNKIESNIDRDVLVNRTLQETGWKVIRFWEKDILNHLEDCIRAITLEIKSLRQGR